MTQQSKQLRRFNRLVGETDAVYHELANRLGLSDSAFQILYTLKSEGGACPLRDICAFSGLTKQTVNSALRKLEAEGSVTTESSGARHKTVTLTPKGAELAEKTVAKVIEIENEILGSWQRILKNTFGSRRNSLFPCAQGRRRCIHEHKAFGSF